VFGRTFEPGFGICLALALVQVPQLAAQSAPTGDWSFRTRGFIAGGSHSSEPDGFKVYSGLGIEVALDRKLNRHLSASLAVRTESREVDSIPASGTALRLGSLELLPMSLLVQYRPGVGGGVRPYFGVGGTLTVAWEKSGVLDSLDVTPYFGPALQAGLDISLSASVLFNADLRWNALQPSLESHQVRLAQLNIDPLTIGLGVGFVF
jgi:outer membrane protein